MLATLEKAPELLVAGKALQSHMERSGVHKAPPSPGIVGDPQKARVEGTASDLKLNTGLGGVRLLQTIWR